MVVEPSFKVTYRGPITAIMKRRKWNNEVEKPSWAQVGLFHKRRDLRKHFTDKGAAEYGYARRTRDYLRAKRKALGHTLPLVYTGELRGAVLSQPEIRPTSKGVKVVLRGAGKANLRPKNSRVRMADELRKISDAEAVRLAKVKDAYMRGRLKNVRGGWTTLIH